MLHIQITCFVSFVQLIKAGNFPAEIYNLQKEINILKEEILNDVRISNIEKDIELITSKKDVETRLQKPREAKANSHATKPAFSARLSQQIGHLGDYQVIVFDHVITNIGSHYNALTGIFHCPETGTYVFYVNIVTVPACQVTTQIAKNGQDVAWTFSMDPVNASSGFNLVTLQLSAGDVVNVRINGNNHDYKNPQLAQLYCGFSGFKI